MKELFLLDDVKSRINMLVEEVEKNFTTISENLGGWHHYLRTQKVSPLGTALGLAILSYKVKKMDHRFLLGINLLEENINQDNGFGIKMIENGRISLTESTSFICLSLATILNNKVELTSEYKNKIIDIMKKCVKWLIDNENPFEGWGPRKGYKSRIFSTSIAIISLKRALESGIFNNASEPKLEAVLQTINSATDWLIRAQNEDGGWGEFAKNQESTAFHTSIAIIALKLTSMCTQKSCENAKKWLLTEWDEKYMWEKLENPVNIAETYDISLGNHEWSRAIWNHFPTAWALIALSILGESFATFEMFKSIKWMLKQTQKGYITRPTDPSPPIWAIWDTLSFFDIFVKFSGNKILGVPKRKQILLKCFRYSIFKGPYGYTILLLLYILVGFFFVLDNLLSTKDYFLGLLVPISLLLIDRLIKWKK